VATRTEGAAGNAASPAGPVRWRGFGRQTGHIINGIRPDFRIVSEKSFLSYYKDGFLWFP
jgi:hypothetical protein